MCSGTVQADGNRSAGCAKQLCNFRIAVLMHVSEYQDFRGPGLQLSDGFVQSAMDRFIVESVRFLFREFRMYQFRCGMASAKPNDVERFIYRRPIEVGLRILVNIRRYPAPHQSHKDSLNDILSVLSLAQNTVCRGMDQVVVFPEDVFEFPR
jgi:hypothetical protein